MFNLVKLFFQFLIVYPIISNLVFWYNCDPWTLKQWWSMFDCFKIYKLSRYLIFFSCQLSLLTVLGSTPFRDFHHLHCYLTLGHKVVSWVPVGDTIDCRWWRELKISPVLWSLLPGTERTARHRHSGCDSSCLCCNTRQVFRNVHRDLAPDLS